MGVVGAVSLEGDSRWNTLPKSKSVTCIIP